MRAFSNLKASIANYKTLDSKDKKTFWKEGFINNLMYILIIIAAIYTYTPVSYTHLTLPTIA